MGLQFIVIIIEMSGNWPKVREILGGNFVGKSNFPFRAAPFFTSIVCIIV